MALRALGDSDAADDAAQESLARALSALREGRGDGIRDLGAFVHGIARNVIADVQRRRYRHVDIDAVVNAPDPSAKPDALSLAVSAEERDRVRGAMRTLSAADRHLLHLSFHEGLTPAAAAERLGETPLIVRKRKSRALERLRQAFLGGGKGHDRSAQSTSHTGAGDPLANPGVSA